MSKAKLHLVVCFTPDTVGKMESLHQRWENWKEDLEIYITASGYVKYGKISQNSRKLSKRQDLEAVEEMCTR